MKIENVDQNSKKHIFLVHGWGGTADSLKKLGELLETPDVVCTNIELPGFGSTPNPPADWGPYEYAGYVRSVIEDMKIDGYENIYIGHSFGGGIGVILASENPSFIDKLILVDSAVYRDPKVDPTVAKLQKLPFYSTVKNSLKQVKKVVYKVAFPGSDSHKFEELESNYRKIISTDLSHHLEKINQQTLILWGEDDKDTLVEEAYRLNKTIRTSEIKVYPGFTHGLPKNNPEAISEDIIKFINKK